MQIYIFECHNCGTEFEEVIYTPLQLMEVKCPSCGSEDVEVVEIVNTCSPFG
ncbi:hypothetical protein Dester_0651 [Desulfurobacterium thermolithotrophum DSM 11699]|uniref:Putative regulatory protein FmdB zinc ribbon domain-containing protein n=1 Tax=Desulfurobacterium thermolithotrophum (strain DSM 11699 / BSA) TaxID=868864 RepID=F0S379_DESTD|nr:zinc ribbon domain-containing protein [Desulfurobacterium thermolithotrophum]ADY73301.1 hypothetical protein Dester_0651 [Desulfurobacterium thermolithotrophum DSM 11699]